MHPQKVLFDALGRLEQAQLALASVAEVFGTAEGLADVGSSRELATVSARAYEAVDDARMAAEVVRAMLLRLRMQMPA